jgi:hypothetical protein
VRIPIPVVILLVLPVGGGTWWWNTRHLDFLTPPSAERLAQVKHQVESSLPATEKPEKSPPPPPVVKELPPPPPVEPAPVVNVGDLTLPPTLQSYGELAPEGPEHLAEVAKALEMRGEFPRALLAWERILDLTKPSESQAATAISSIKRLRPTLPDWNTRTEATISITLHAGTGKKLAKTLTPILEGVARDLEAASSGTLKVKATVTAGKTSTPKGPAPIALWLTGVGKKPSSTETLSFTAGTPDTLRATILKTIFLLVQSQLSRTTAYTPPAALGDGEDPQSALNFRVTRLGWSEFAAGLNLPQKKKP